MTPISGLRSFTEASMAAQTLSFSLSRRAGPACTPDTACAVPFDHLDETREINDSELGSTEPNPPSSEIGARSASTESERGAECARIDHGHYYYARGTTLDAGRRTRPRPQTFPCNPPNPCQR